MHRVEKYTKLFQTKLGRNFLSAFLLVVVVVGFFSCRCSQRVYSAIEAKKYLITIVLVLFFS